MIQICNFNADRDIMESVPGLATDLSLAIDNGVVLDTGIDATYNEVDDPANIRGRVRDAFQAIDAQKAVLSAGKIVNPTSEVSTPSGELS